MSDTPTPETDAAWHSFTGNTEFAHNVKNLSRKLERERGEAREALREAWLAMDEVDGTDRMVNWQNKHASILEGAK